MPSINSADNSSQAMALRIADMTRQETTNALTRIASGLRINKAADDAAGLGISERLRALSNGFQQAEYNLQGGISVLQVAEGALGNINDAAQRARELAVRASNDTLTDADRGVIQEEIDQLVEEIDRQSAGAQFNGQAVLSGAYSAANGGLQIQAGTNEGETISIALEQTDASSLGLSGLDVSTRDAASAAIGRLDSAIATMSGRRTAVGSDLNRLESSISFVGIARENAQSALTQVRDADLAQEAVNLSLLQIREQGGLAAISQGNIGAQSVLRLLG